MTPMAVEYVAVRRGAPGAVVVCSGIGAVRSRAAALRAERAPVAALAVAGFCGGVAEGLRPGDVVVAAEVCGQGVVTTCETAALVAALATEGVERVHTGRLVSVDHVVHEAERAALAVEGFTAVDMESAWLAPAAAGRPFVVLRVVLDAAGRSFGRPAALRGPLTAWRALRRAAPALSVWAGLHEAEHAAGAACSPPLRD
ncbi:MAG TPA: 1-hydroxy-2-methyl-2-butenyl 4-diphosphate reductase [Thermoleophilia bacterium]|nr:1-hydroxy-2-methyl-2-butenyl 4-diphosphate reductase [Thermoleophilia bacterium]